MPNLELSLEEMEMTREVLEHALHEVDHEISRSDRLDFKQMLKHRKVVLEQSLRKFADEPMRAAA